MPCLGKGFSECPIAPIFIHKSPFIFRHRAFKQESIAIKQHQLALGADMCSFKIADHFRTKIVQKYDPPLSAMAVENWCSKTDHRFQRLLNLSSFNIEIKWGYKNFSPLKLKGVFEIITLTFRLKFIFPHDCRFAVIKIDPHNFHARFVQETYLVVEVLSFRIREELFG